MSKGAKSLAQTKSIILMQTTVKKTFETQNSNRPLQPIWAFAKFQRGFTAVELMVVIAIMAVLAALAAPSFKPLIEKWRVNDAREAMSSALFLVRSEAIKRGGNVVLEKTELGADCPHASTTQEWSCGWFVYFDKNGNGAYDAGTDVLVQTFPPPKKLNVMTPSNQTRFTFDRWGNSSLSVFGFVLSPDPDGVTSPATATLCVAAGGRARYLPGEVTCS